jgi:Icc-related predicted phosphoesterase
MGKKVRLYFVTDLHGSSKCFRKFVNAAPVYKADILILGGDLAGKAIQTIVREPDGRWHCRFIGTDYHVDAGPDLAALEKLIEDHGLYPTRMEPGEFEALEASGGLDAYFLTLMERRLTDWLTIADDRLRPIGIPLYLMLGNDDPIELRAILDRAPWGIHAARRGARPRRRHAGRAAARPGQARRGRLDGRPSVPPRRAADARPSRAHP